MKTENLNKTNIISQSVASEIEAVLGCEIDSVYTYKPGYQRSIKELGPGNNVWDFKYGRIPYLFCIKKAEFNKESGVLTLIGRDKYQRKDKTIKYQYSIVGYKLPTTHIDGGYIFGLPIEIVN